MELHFDMDTAVRQPSFFMPYNHTHTLTELYYLKDGECTCFVNDRYVALQSGDVLLIRPGEPHRMVYGGSRASFRADLLLDEGLVWKMLQAADAATPEIHDILAGTCRISLDPFGLHQLEHLLSCIGSAQSAQKTFLEQAVCLYVCEIFLLLAGHGQISRSFFVPVREMDHDIQEALQYLDTMYAQPLTLEQTAARFGLTPSYFSHKFHMITGYTFREYLSNIRVRSAARRLLISDDSITKIAMNCGFSSSNYFKDVFRRHYGVSPRAYRKEGGVSSKLGYGHTPDEPAGAGTFLPGGNETTESPDS